MPGRARLDAPGTLHHVIVRGIEKRKIVDDDQDRVTFIEKLGELSIRTQTAIYAWALMSNHAHLLLRSGQQGLSSFMRKLLIGYAGYYNRRYHRHGHLFQNRYKSIEDLGLSFAEIARLLGVSTSAITRIYQRKKGVVHNMLTLYTANGHKSRFGVIVFGYHRDRDRHRYRRSVE